MQQRHRYYVRFQIVWIYHFCVACALNIARQRYEPTFPSFIEVTSPPPLETIGRHIERLEEKVERKLQEPQTSLPPDSDSTSLGEYKSDNVQNIPANLPPIIGDYNPETVIIWSGTSEFSITVESLIAASWILMVASMPLISIILDKEKITKTQMVVFVVMWIVFLGGIYLFHNVIKFNSVHFTSTRSLTVVESVYLLAQILTTVGYGDITPATPRAQVFVAFYVVFSLIVIANVVQEVYSLISEHTKEMAKDFHRMVSARLTSFMEDSPTESATKGQLDRTTTRHLTEFTAREVKLDYSNLAKTSAAYVFFVILGCVFFVNYPGENKTWFEGVYMSIITLSTVGFGAITPQTEAGKAFSAFWMLFGSASLVAVVGSATDLFQQVKQRERNQLPPGTPRNVRTEKFVEGLQAESDKFDFFKRNVLYKGLIDSDEIEEFERLWEEFAAKNYLAGGKVNRSMLQNSLRPLG